MRPHHVLIFIACCLACLAALCLVLPNRVTVAGYTLHWPTLAQVFHRPVAAETTPDMPAEWPTDTAEIAELSDYIEDEIPEFPIYSGPIDTFDLPDWFDIPEWEDEDEMAEAPSMPKRSAYVHVAQQPDSSIDSRLFLQSFYASLAEARTRKIRVVHYGDSQIEEDRMTQQIRQKLQARFGGAGAGLVPLAQTIPSRTVHQELYMNGYKITPQQGPRRYLVYGPKRTQREDGLYGPMGQMAVMNDTLVRGSEHLKAVVVPRDGGPRYSRVQVLCEPSVYVRQEGDTVHLSGRGNVYGISQESETGVIVDNMPMRGCLGLVFTKMDADQLTQFYTQENVSLIILQFGGNGIPYNNSTATIRSIVNGLRRQVRYLQDCAPDANILFIGPSDMIATVNGVPQTHPMVSYMDRLLQKMAMEEEIAYFSLYRWMGGRGSMAHWQDIGLAGSDGVHFTRSGARKAGNAVADWILEGLTTND